jgi:cold shock CspA family protein
MIEIFKKRPFKTRNADEYNLSDILSLFVNPIVGLSSPLDFENSIVKGRMGSGKTMFLRANYAYYLFNLVPSLLEEEELVLPVFVRLSDFQHLKESSEIYNALIIKIVEELSTIYLKLQDAKYMANVHHGMKKVQTDLYFSNKIKTASTHLLKLGSEEYLEKITNEFSASGKAQYKFFELSSQFQKSTILEIKEKQNPGIKDIKFAYDTLLSDSGGKILLLIDEAGSLDKNFFRNENGDSFFEIFMNQLRTTDFIRTKVAVYPNSFSDILTETRYGDVVMLEENIDNNNNYQNYRNRVIGVIENYINVNEETEKHKASDIFEINEEDGEDCIEQIINASGGNYRRLIQLLDSTMNESFIRNQGVEKVNINDAILAIKKHCEIVLSSYTPLEKEYIINVAKVCKGRTTYRFNFPNNAQVLYKYMSKSQEFNIMKILEAGSGRRGTTYAFDYSFCLLHDIPTHYIRNSERIDKNRSLSTGEWITRNATLNQEVLLQAEIPDKLEGKISFTTADSSRGFIRCENDTTDYFFRADYIIESDRNKHVFVGKKVKFCPGLLGDSKMASQIEII